MVETIKKTEAKENKIENVVQTPVNEIEKSKTESPKKEEKKLDNKIKRTEAKVEGNSLHISRKYSVAICNYIRGKNIDKAISMLEEVQAYKKAIPMRGEIPHRKGMMSGRFITKSVTEFIGLLKSLRANAVTNELELEKYIIFAKANVASRPYRRNGKGRGKRTHVSLKLIKPIKKIKKKKS